MKKQFRKSGKIQTGFTLIELMIVVAIIGILAAVAMPLYLTHLRQSIYVEITQGAKLAKSALETCIYFENDLDRCDTPAELQAHGYRTNFASNSELIASVEIVRLGSNIGARVTPNTGVVGATFLQSEDTYILRGDVATQGTDLLIESWSIDPSSGCVTKQYC